MAQDQPGLPTIKESLGLTESEIFLRRIARPRLWIEAREKRDPKLAEQFLLDQDATVSLWIVKNDTDLRRISIAINESRDSFRENIDFLPILPEELSRAGVAFEQTPGETTCEAAAGLHVDAKIDETSRSALLQILITAGRDLGKCTRGQMKKAFDEALRDACFAATEGNSTKCACGAEKAA